MLDRSPHEQACKLPTSEWFALVQNLKAAAVDLQER